MVRWVQCAEKVDHIYPQWFLGVPFQNLRELNKDTLDFLECFTTTSDTLPVREGNIKNRFSRNQHITRLEEVITLVMWVGNQLFVQSPKVSKQYSSHAWNHYYLFALLKSSVVSQNCKSPPPWLSKFLKSYNMYNLEYLHTSVECYNDF